MSEGRMKILADGTATICPGRDRSERRRIRGYPHLFGLLASFGIRRMTQDVEEFVRGAHPTDDRTVLAMRVR
jgi:hypothetical protein